MEELRLRIMGDEILRGKAKPIESFDAELTKLGQKMSEVMYEANGVGLAAPQVGLLKRIIVVDVEYKEKGMHPIVMVNPEIIMHSSAMCTREEGCLSVPDYYADVTRPEAVKVAYFDVKGNRHVMEATGNLARCVQHEIDHLDGKLFTDYLSQLKRIVVRKKMQKLRSSLNMEEGTRY
jgi:peptide deformylase